MTESSGASMMVEPLASAPAPPPRRPRVLMVGSVLGGTAASAAIAALASVYAKLRSDHLAGSADEPWLGDVHIELTPGNMALVTLLMSAVTAAAVTYSLRRGDRPHAYLSLATTLLLGAAFITGTAYIWQQMGVAIDGSRAAVLILVLSGAHVAMVAVGMLYLLVMGFRAFGGQLTGRAAEGYSAAVVFWYITIAAYALVWYTIYIVK